MLPILDSLPLGGTARCPWALRCVYALSSCSSPFAAIFDKFTRFILDDLLDFHNLTALS